MNVKRLFLSAVALTVFHFFWGWLTCGWLFTSFYSLPPTEVWRSMENVGASYWTLVNAGYFIIALIYTFVYSKVGKLIAGNWLKKGLVYGLFLWLLTEVTGVYYSYNFMTINKVVLIYWLINGLISLLITGALIALIYPIKKNA